VKFILSLPLLSFYVSFGPSGSGSVARRGFKFSACLRAGRRVDYRTRRKKAIDQIPSPSSSSPTPSFSSSLLWIRGSSKRGDWKRGGSRNRLWDYTFFLSPPPFLWLRVKSGSLAPFVGIRACSNQIERKRRIFRSVRKWRCI